MDWERVYVNILPPHKRLEELEVNYSLQLLACIDISIGIFQNETLFYPPTHKRKRFVSLKIPVITEGPLNNKDLFFG